MKKGWSRALGLGLVVVAAACGKKSGSAGAGGAADASVHGPTHLVARWTFTGQPADATSCTAHGGSQVYVNLSGTIDPSLHATSTVDCAKASVDLGTHEVEDLGMPFLETTLLDDMGTSVAMASADVTPVLGSTTVTLDFFPAMGAGGMGGMGGMSTTVASSAAASTSAASTAASTAAASTGASSSGAGGSSSTSGAGGKDGG